MSKPFRLKHPEPKEAQVLRSVLQVLAMHPKVAWAHRMQTGAGKLLRRGNVSQFLRFGWVGASDVIGQLRGTGQLLAIECKSRGGDTTPEQEEFLRQVRAAGGVAFVARCVEDVLINLPE